MAQRRSHFVSSQGNSVGQTGSRCSSCSVRREQLRRRQRHLQNRMRRRLPRRFRRRRAQASSQTLPRLPPLQPLPLLPPSSTRLQQHRRPLQPQALEPNLRYATAAEADMTAAPVHVPFLPRRSLTTRPVCVLLRRTRTRPRVQRLPAARSPTRSARRATARAISTATMISTTQ
jgi:hypothetical protein